MCLAVVGVEDGHTGRANAGNERSFKRARGSFKTGAIVAAEQVCCRNLVSKEARCGDSRSSSDPLAEIAQVIRDDSNTKLLPCSPERTACSGKSGRIKAAIHK